MGTFSDAKPVHRTVKQYSVTHHDTYAPNKVNEVQGLLHTALYLL